MNQSILFNDDFYWDEAGQRVRLTAQSGGAIITCYLTISYLQRLGLTSSLPQEIIAYCEMVQFDIEEDAQQGIADEHLDNNSTLCLT